MKLLNVERNEDLRSVDQNKRGAPIPSEREKGGKECGLTRLMCRRGNGENLSGSVREFHDSGQSV